MEAWRRDAKMMGLEGRRNRSTELRKRIAVNRSPDSHRERNLDRRGGDGIELIWGGEW